MLGVSDGLVIVGIIALVVFGVFFWLLDALNIPLAKDDFIVKILPYDLLLGLVALGSGIGIKVYHAKNSSG